MQCFFSVEVEQGRDCTQIKRKKQVMNDCSYFKFLTLAHLHAISTSHRMEIFKCINKNVKLFSTIKELEKNFKT
jgi:hypothetical protein